MHSIPVVDISPLLLPSPSNEEEKLHVSRAIRRACETVGFVQVIDHGVNERLFDAMIFEARRFFAQSPDEKRRYTVHKWNPLNKNTYRGYFPSSVNGKEGLDMSSPYLDPEYELVKQGNPLHELNVSSMDGVLTQYWNEMCKLKCVTSSLTITSNVHRMPIHLALD
jgi:isopenicillin N synthase-like dioxygenase